MRGARSRVPWPPTGLARVLALVLAALVAGCGGPHKPELWIYTSIYREVLDSVAPRVQAAFPDVTLRWYKAGSEEVAARVTAELAAGACQADVLMTADIFWYENLKREGHLMPLPADVRARVPARLADPDGHYVASRAGAMVLAINTRVLPLERAPRSLADLTRQEWMGKVVIGDPLKSGTSFVTVAALSHRYGWEYYRALRANRTIVEGGNSAVLRRVELGERPVGVLLLENLLKAARGKSPARCVIPADGAIVIPSPIAVMARTRMADAALRLCRYMLGPVGQEAMVAGWMYPVVPGIAGPAGAPPFEDLLVGGTCPDPTMVRQVAAAAEEIKETFVRVMFE